MLVCWNAPAGPLADNTRHRALSEAWSHMFEHTDARTNLLFRELLPGILADSGAFDKDCGDGVDLDVWRSLKSSPPFEGPKEKANLNRFFSTPATARHCVANWHSQLLNFSYLALEEGWMDGAKMPRIVLRDKAPLNETTARASTDVRRPQPPDKFLRSSGQNAVALAVCMYSEAEHNQLVRIILEFAEPLESWHRHQNHTLRDSDSSFQWLVSQSAGGFMAHCEAILGKLTSVSALQRCRIRCPWNFALDPEDSGGLLIVREDEMSTALGDGCMDLVGRRLARCMFAFGGFPMKLLALHAGEPHPRKVLQDFRETWEAFKWMEDQPLRTEAVEAVLARSFFRHVSVDQFVQVVSGRPGGGTKSGTTEFVIELAMHLLGAPGGN